MLFNLKLFPNSINQKKLDLDNLNIPCSLVELYIKIDTIAIGLKVIPRYLKVYIK
jgi:hypothetical protein